jgi:hypothetical protein
MKSKIAERTLSETPQETKNKAREVTDRQIQLQRLGFTRNEHQRVFDLYKYGVGWVIDFHEVTDKKDSEWDTFIGCLKYDLVEAKKQLYIDLKENNTYLFAQKEFKKKILDNLNKYRSWLADETRCKMGRNPNFARELELRSKIEILKELYDIKRDI